MSAVTGRLARVVGAGAVIGTASLAYALWEARQYTLREASIGCLPPGSRDMRVLHLSDLHLTPHQTDKAGWIRDLSRLEPDLTVVTGDFLAHRDSVAVVLDALAPLLERPGLFVLGSNDYYEPRVVNPLGYLSGPSQHDARREFLPWGDLVSGLRLAGWTDLDNARAELTVAGTLIDARGVDDPHMERDDYTAVAGPFDPTAGLRLGISHAPYLRILDAMDADGADLILAGHTHGGQVCLPGGRAIVTNCDIDPRRARGVHRHREGQLVGSDRQEGAWLHVSAGLGTAPMAPIRFFCRPEATLLTLTAAG